MNDRIEDNPSHKKLKKELDGANALSKLTDLFSLLGANPKELKEAFEPLADLQKQFELISKSPDKFNDYFSKKGWIAHESMNHDLMLTCIEFAEKGHIELAEQELINYYSSDDMRWLTHQLKGTKEFSVRYSLIQAAYEDTIAERYYACIPVLLLVIDGGVNDVDRNKGFFADSTDLTAWDSIAAHSTGLATLKEIFNDTRKRTTEEEITMPYRHGILHGRDINYANKTVAAKCWAALFALNDWAKAVKSGKKNPPPEEPKLSFNEIINELNTTLENYKESQKRNKEVSRKADEWAARNLEIGVDIPQKGLPNEYKELTPEREAVQFIENWKSKNYGAIAKQIHFFTKAEINWGKEAGRVRKVFQNKVLKDYAIVNVKDCSPAITEITLSVDIIFEEKEYKKEITLRFIYDGLNGEFLVFGHKGGQWKFIESFFHTIDYLY
jgi:hypothetical protein